MVELGSGAERAIKDIIQILKPPNSMGLKMKIDKNTNKDSYTLIELQ